MPANADEEVTELLKPVLKKRLFAPNKAVAPLEDLLPFVAEHLTCMNHAERRETLRLRAFGRRWADDPADHDRGCRCAHVSGTVDPARFEQFDRRPWELRERPYDDHVECCGQPVFDWTARMWLEV